MNAEKKSNVRNKSKITQRVDPNDWAKQRKEKMEAAKKIREERKA